MNFKNQISTSREQSERLLSLGLKPETADMCYIDDFLLSLTDEEMQDLPSWSLSRLLDIMPESIFIKSDRRALKLYPPVVAYVYDNGAAFFDSMNIFENIIDMIDWLIQNGHFNKEYLKQE
jgi:hypothetical protein